MDGNAVSIFEAAAKSGAEEGLERLNSGEKAVFSEGINIVRASTLKRTTLLRSPRTLPGGGCVVCAACYMIGSLSDSELKSLFNKLGCCVTREEHFLVVKEVLGKKTQDAISKVNPSIARTQGVRYGPPAAMKTVLIKVLGEVTDILATHASNKMRQEIYMLERGLREKDKIIQEQRAVANRLRFAKAIREWGRS